jgi:hypothetical protein
VRDHKPRSSEFGGHSHPLTEREALHAEIIRAKLAAFPGPDAGALRQMVSLRMARRKIDWSFRRHRIRAVGESFFSAKARPILHRGGIRDRLPVFPGFAAACAMCAVCGGARGTLE